MIGHGHINIMAAMSIYDKNLKQILYFSPELMDCFQPKLVYRIGDSIPSVFIYMYINHNLWLTLTDLYNHNLKLTLTYFTAWSSLVTHAFNWGMCKQRIFQTIYST